MEKEFATYEISVKVKELGFDEPCFGRFYQHSTLQHISLFTDNNTDDISKRKSVKLVCKAPLWQQIIDWLREEHKININIDFIGIDKCSFIIENLNKIDPNFLIPEFLFASGTAKEEDFMSYNEAREQVILKAIELCKNKDINYIK